MPLEQALQWTEKFAALALILQAFEFISLRKDIQKIWRRNLLLLHCMQLLVALYLLMDPHFFINGLLLLLFLLQIYFFRGPFNGGSDYMLAIVLLSTTTARAFPDLVTVQKFCLGYIAVQLCLSYVISGLAKLKQSDWRQGLALQRLLHADYCSVPVMATGYFEKVKIYSAVSIGIIVFECLFPIVFLDSRLAIVFVVAAGIFHLSNFFVLGLNRFVWSWLAAYPALLYFAFHR